MKTENFLEPKAAGAVTAANMGSGRGARMARTANLHGSVLRTDYDRNGLSRGSRPQRLPAADRWAVVAHVGETKCGGVIWRLKLIRFTMRTAYCVC